MKRTSFFPSPNVDAALVHFRVKQAAEYPAVTSPRAFFTLVVRSVKQWFSLLGRSELWICLSRSMARFCRVAEAAALALGLSTQIGDGCR